MKKESRQDLKVLSAKEKLTMIEMIDILIMFYENYKNKE